MFRKKPEQTETVEWMIVGLGNPGPEYRGTRHNVGFEVVDLLSERHRIKLARGRQRAIVGTGTIRNHSIALVKPLTFMNLSGQAVAPLSKLLGVKPARILVVADDLDLPLGKLRLRAKGSSGGHNGHKSVMASLQTDEYPRMKIGIDSVDRHATIEHVLSTFDRNERECAQGAIATAADVCETVLEDWEEALQQVERYNKT